MFQGKRPDHECQRSVAGERGVRDSSPGVEGQREHGGAGSAEESGATSESWAPDSAAPAHQDQEEGWWVSLFSASPTLY